jgi:hypothetical protein
VLKPGAVSAPGFMFAVISSSQSISLALRPRSSIKMLHAIATSAAVRLRGASMTSSRPTSGDNPERPAHPNNFFSETGAQ